MPYSRMTCLMPHLSHTGGLHASLIPHSRIMYMLHTSHKIGLHATLIPYSRITCLTHSIQKDYMPHSSNTVELHVSLIPHRGITCLTHSIQKDYMPHSSQTVGLHTSLIPFRRITCLPHPIQRITFFKLQSSHVIVFHYSRITGPSNKSSHNLAFWFLTTARLAKGRGHELRLSKSCIHYK